MTDRSLTNDKFEFSASFTGSIFPLIFDAYNWKDALEIALAHETTSNKLKLLNMGLGY